jgi:energy-coupling factor transporter transmembrane protein EcfT
MLLLSASFLVELVVGLAMLLRPRQMRQWLMPDYHRYEGKFAATSLLTYRFVGIVALLMAALNGYAYVQLSH